MANRWTAQQKEAIQIRDCDLLVSAAAGSGKTAVLVERIITRIIKEEQEIDRLLVVTFTKAAAAEMSQRIGAAISKRLQETPNDIHLQNQMTFLPRADIKTIHAFCLQVIREYYHILGLDPAMRTADPSEIKLLQNEVLEELFEQLYADESNGWFFDLLETFGQPTNDRALKDLILEIYAFAQANPDPKGLLDDMAAGFLLGEEETVDDCDWFPLIRQGVASVVEYARYQLRRAEEMAQSPGFEGYLEKLEQERQQTDKFYAVLDKPYDQWLTAYGEIAFTRLLPYKGKEKEKAEQIKEWRNDAKKALNKLKESFFCYRAETQSRIIRKAYPIAQGLTELTKRFMDTFGAAKREKLMMDFNDYEHFALQVLVEAGSTPERILPTAAAKELQQRYDEIMIDEYQDSNLVQEMILTAVSGESRGQNNRFMVGDVKQSIYRFRQAMPELFNEKYEIYPPEEGGKTRKVILSKNFRSRKNILDGINFLFRQIMQKEFGDVAYDAEASLYAGAAFPETTALCGGANEVILAEMAEQEDSELTEEMQELNRRQLEANVIVKKIKELLTSGFQVWDGKIGEYRPVAYGDIAILLRSMKNWSAVLDDVFGREGLPYYAETAEGYYSVPEVETVLHLLRLVDNPRQDIPLLSILHSPLYGLTAEELVQIRLGGGKGLYFDCIHTYLEQGEDEELRGRLSAFLGNLADWRKQARNVSLPELLRYLYRETGYYDYLGMTAGGELRQANLRLLLEKAEQYEKGSRKGLFYFIRYVEDMKTAEAETSAAKLMSEGENLIRVMTIHKSKGLEFPVVFVSDMGKAFNDMDARSPVILHQKWGYGMDYADLEQRTVYRSLSKTALAEAIRQENLAEETRVLYVALTRAKEKLILTGVKKDMKKAMMKWLDGADCQTEALPIFRLRRGKSYLDWVMPAVLRHGDCAHLPEKWGLEQNVTSPLFAQEASRWQVSLLTREEALREVSGEQKKAAEQKNYFAQWKTPAEMTEERKEVFRILSWQYPYGKETGLPTKLSISEIKRKYQAEILGEAPTVAVPLSFLREKKDGLTAAQIGTAMHTFLEEADLRQPYDMPAIEALAEKLMQQGRLTAEEGAALRKQELLGFFQSDLAKRLRESDRIEKERAFSLLMEPKELFFGREYADVTDTILVNGIIDCFFTEGDSVILLDYKSDRIYKEEELRQRYQVQLRLYRLALERALQVSVKEMMLYSFAMGKAVVVE